MACVSAKEQCALQKFQDAAKTLGQDEKTLLRFLRARDGDLTKALSMLQNAIEWRKDNNVNSYLHWKPPKLLVDDFRFECCGLDNEGHAVIYLPVGAWNVRDMLAKDLKEECMKYRFYMLENFIEFQRKSSRDQFSIIIDSAEMSYWKVAHIETIQVILACFRDFEANYPERLRSAFVINTPWVFSYIYAFVKPLLSSHTLGKVQIFDSDQTKWKNALMEQMPETCIPKIYQSTEEL